MNIVENDRLSNQRERRKLNGNADTKKYEKTKRGFLMRLYRNMQSRVEGIQKLKQHLYKDKYLLDRETFYNWAMYDEGFHALFADWEFSGYSKKLTPSVDRIKSELGYIIENMEWVTHSENSRRGAVSRHEKNSSNR